MSQFVFIIAADEKPLTPEEKKLQDVAQGMITELPAGKMKAFNLEVDEKFAAFVLQVRYAAEHAAVYKQLAKVFNSFLKGSSKGLPSPAKKLYDKLFQLAKESPHIVESVKTSLGTSESILMNITHKGHALMQLQRSVSAKGDVDVKVIRQLHNEVIGKMQYAEKQGADAKQLIELAKEQFSNFEYRLEQSTSTTYTPRLPKGVKPSISEADARQRAQFMLDQQKKEEEARKRKSAVATMPETGTGVAEGVVDEDAETTAAAEQLFLLLSMISATLLKAQGVLEQWSEAIDEVIDVTARFVESNE